MPNKSDTKIVTLLSSIEPSCQPVSLNRNNWLKLVTTPAGFNQIKNICTENAIDSFSEMIHNMIEQSEYSPAISGPLQTLRDVKTHAEWVFDHDGEFVIDQEEEGACLWLSVINPVDLPNQLKN